MFTRVSRTLSLPLWVEQMLNVYALLFLPLSVCMCMCGHRPRGGGDSGHARVR